MNFIFFPIPEMERVISAAVKGEDITRYEPFKSLTYTREERWYRLTISSRISAILKKFSDEFIDLCIDRISSEIIDGKSFVLKQMI